MDAGEKLNNKKTTAHHSGFIIRVISPDSGNQFYPFIEVRNSILSFVPFIFFISIFNASSGFISAR